MRRSVIEVVNPYHDPEISAAKPFCLGTAWPSNATLRELGGLHHSVHHYMRYYRHKAPLHMVGESPETPPLGSVWHDARGFESKVDVEVDAAGKEAFSRKYIHVLHCAILTLRSTLPSGRERANRSEACGRV